jgi:hypothetical protein
VTVIVAHKLQALRHAAANVRDEIEVGRLPLDADPVLQLLHRTSVMRVHAALEVVPQILDRVEIRTPCRPINEIDAMIVEPHPTGAGGVDGPVVLLIPPLSARPELTS